MSQWNYFVTAQKPTAVAHALGPLRFTSSKPLDLVVVRAGRLEVFHLKRGGGPGGKLEAILDLSVQARVATLEAFRPTGSQRDLLFLLSEKRQLVIFGYDFASKTVVTLAMASLHDGTGRPVDHAPLCACDPGGRVAAVYLYEGILKFVPLAAVPAVASSSSSQVPVQLCERGQGVIFSTRVAEPRVLDIAFLHTSHGQDMPTLAVLHADGQGSRFLSAWAVDLQARDLFPRSMDSHGNSPMKAGSSKLVPVPLPLGGTLVLGGSSVNYHDDAGRRIAAVSGGPRDISAMALVEEDGSQWLMSGIDGGLWLLRLQVPAGSGAASTVTSLGQPATALMVEHLGITSLPTALACLNDGYVFVGSAEGDSQLLRLASGASRGGSDGNHFSVEESWTNLGPILDFCVADVDDQGQNQIVTCSGVNRTGSLRFVRIGIGVNEVAALSGFEGVLGMWALGGVGSRADNHSVALVLSFAASTRVLAMRGDSASAEGAELAEKPAPGFVSDEQTLFCCESSGVALQVTRGGVRAASLEALTPLAWWSAPSGTRALAACAAPKGLVISLSTGDLVLLHAQPASSPGGSLGLQVAAQLRLAAEVSCLHACDNLFVVGLWSGHLQMLNLRDGTIEQAHREDGLVETIPRSCLLTKLSGVLHLVVGMGDGRLLTFHVNDQTGALSQKKAVSLGAQPIRLLSLGSQLPASQDIGEHILAAGDRPMIIHAHGTTPGHLAYAAVNLRHVSHVAPFDALPFRGCLAFLTERRLMIGSFDAIQRVHVRTVPLGRSPHRISYQQHSNIFAVACQPEDPDELHTPSNSLPLAVSSSSSCGAAPPLPPDMSGGLAACALLQFVHGRSLEIVQSLRLEPQEQVSAMVAVVFDGDPCEYLVVGTAQVCRDEPEPLHGRILVYANKMTPASACKCGYALVAEIDDVHGAVYALAPFKGGLLGTVNNRVSMWRWSGNSLETTCSFSGNIIALYLQVMDDYIMVGDLMRSASLLAFKEEDNVLVEVARDASSAWLTSIVMLSENVFLCADDAHNVFTLQRGSASPTPASPAAAGIRAAGNPAMVADDASTQLERVGQMHMGEFVNRMHRASLVEHPVALLDTGSAADERSSFTPLKQVVWASVDGAIGLIVSLRDEQEFARLSIIQDVIAQEAREQKVFGLLEGLPHGEWRDYWAEAQGPLPHKGFIDGNLLELVLELPRTAQQAIVDRLGARNVVMDGVLGLMRELENLVRLH